MHHYATGAFVVTEEEDVNKLHAIWKDTGEFYSLTSNDRALVAMQEASRFGLVQMPSEEPGIASLIDPPDEALWPNACHPQVQGYVIDSII